MKYKAIIFDLHGTLIPWSKPGFRSMLSEMAFLLGAPDEDFARALNQKVPEAMCGMRGSIYEQAQETSNELGINPQISQLDQAVKLWTDFHRQGYKNPYSGALNLLQQIKGMDIKIGMITNCGAEAPDLWNHSQFAPLADVAVFSCKEGILKPDPRIYLMACKRLNVPQDKCLYIDDSVKLLSGASEVGMSTLLIRHPGNLVGLSSLEEWTGPRVTSLQEVTNYL